MNLVYTEEAERLIAHENAQWTAYAEYPLRGFWTTVTLYPRLVSSL